jgi:hypothetical protein
LLRWPAGELCGDLVIRDHIGQPVGAQQVSVAGVDHPDPGAEMQPAGSDRLGHDMCLGMAAGLSGAQ